MGQDPQDDPLLENVPLVEGRKHLGPCALHERIGSGGMGTVYRGRHLNLDIDVAVKCLHPSLAQQDQKFVARFQREAKLAASIDHENLIRVYDVGSQNDVHYIVMEFVRGETSRERVARKGPLSEREAWAILFGAASALGAAHARGIVHRDIKPDNILVATDGRVKVADLGLAKPLAETSTLTQGLMGTPRYMAPEQWSDPDAVGPWTDIWALGATLFFMLVGRDPFRGASAGQTFPDVRSARRGLTRPLVELLNRCVDADPRRRFANAGELVQQLRRRGIPEGVADLADPAGGTTTLPAQLVSPPPGMGRRRASGTSAHDDASGGTVEVSPRQPTPTSVAITVPPQRTRRWRQRIWTLAGGVALAAGIGAGAILVAGGLTPSANGAACQRALDDGDLDRALTLFEAVPASDGSKRELGVRLATQLRARAARSAEASELTAALADVRRARELAPGPEADAATTRIEETVRTSLRGTRVSPPADAVVGRKPTLTVAGDELVRCTIGDRTFELTDGTGSCELELGADGPVRLTLQLEHRSGLTVDLEHTLRVDGSPPTLACSEPRAGAFVGSPFVATGTITDASTTEVRVNGRAAAVENERWECTMDLPDGPRQLAIEAEDAAGNRSTLVRLDIVVDSEPPTLELEPVPETTASTSIEVVGNTEPGAGVRVDGTQATVGEEGRFRSRVPLPEEGERVLDVVAADRAGNESKRSVRVTRVRGAGLSLRQPGLEDATWYPVVLFEGRVEPWVSSLTIGGVKVPSDPAGTFRYAGQFQPGSLDVVATDAGGGESKTTIELRRPRELLLEVDPPETSQDRTVQITGTTEPAASVRLADRVVAAGPDGRFALDADLPGPGSHEVAVHAWRADTPGHLGVEVPPECTAAALVESVQPDSAASRMGIRPGDVIEAIDGQPTDAQGLLRTVSRSPTRSLALSVRRGTERLALQVTPWPAPLATVSIRVEVADAVPIPPGLVPVFGIEPGVTTRADVDRQKAARPGGTSLKEVTYRDGVVEHIVLEKATGALPPNWTREGLEWGQNFDACSMLAKAKGWVAYRARAPAAFREGTLELEVQRGLRIILLFAPGEDLYRAEIKVGR